MVKTIISRTLGVLGEISVGKEVLINGKKCKVTGISEVVDGVATVYLTEMTVDQYDKTGEARPIFAVNAKAVAGESFTVKVSDVSVVESEEARETSDGK